MNGDNQHYLCDLKITVNPRPEDHKDLVIVLDASGSMSPHYTMLKAIADTCIKAGCAVVFFSSSAISFQEGSSWNMLEKSGAWGQVTNYRAALDVAKELITSDTGLLFMTDGEPSDTGYSTILLETQEILGSGSGFMQSMFLGSGANMTVLRNLCSSTKSPILVGNATEFEECLRSFLSNSINLVDGVDTVRVGSFEVSKAGGEGGKDLTDCKDVAFMCGAVAAILRYLRLKDTRYVSNIVKVLNKWMAALGSTHYGVQRLMDLGRTIAADIAVSDDMASILHAGKVLTLQTRNLDELELLALVCMANNPPTWVRKAYIARQKLRARFKDYLRLQSSIIKQFGPDLLRVFPVKCVMLLVDDGLLAELQKLRAGETTGVERATMAIQNPCNIDVRFGTEWTCYGLDEYRERPSAMLDISDTLKAPCVRLATSALLGMCTSLSPWMLINAIWTTIQDQSGWPLARQVMAVLQAYNKDVFCMHKPNPFVFYPNPQPHPFGYSFTDGMLQVPSIKAALLAAFFADDVAHQPEFGVRCILPIVVALNSTWPNSMAAIQRTVQFTCTPLELQKILQEPGGMLRIPFGPVRVDISQAIHNEEFQSHLAASAQSLPTFDELQAAQRFLADKEILSPQCVAMAIARYAVVRSIYGGASFSQLEFNTALVTCGFRSVSETVFELKVPPGKLVHWVHEQVVAYVRSIPLPSDILALANNIDLTAEIRMIIEGSALTERTGQEASTLLHYCKNTEERLVVLKAICPQTVTTAQIGLWKPDWKREFLTYAPMHCVGACLDGISGPCTEVQMFFNSMSAYNAMTVIAGLMNRVRFADHALVEETTSHPDYTNFLDRCITIPGFCADREEIFVAALEFMEEPTTTQLRIASGIHMHQPGMLKSAMLGPILLRGVYHKVTIGLQLKQMVTIWLGCIGELTQQTAFDFLTKKTNNLIMRYGWIQRQLVGYDGDLLRLIHLRKQVAVDGGSKFGPRMALHNAGMEVLYDCIMEGTTTVPDSYRPMHVPEDIFLF